METAGMLKQAIKGYWEDHQPGIWYSDLEEGTEGFFSEIETIRYKVSYPHLYKLMEFDKHCGEKVLEVGCGIGTDILQFAKNGAIVTGVDLTEKAVALAQKRFEQRGFAGTFLRADAENLPFEDETFDMVYSYGVLHHTPDTQKAVNEVYRVLKRGGKAVVMLYHKGLLYYYNFLFVNGILKGELFRMSVQEILNKYMEVKGNSPLAKMYSQRRGRLFFTKFRKVDSYIRVLQGLGRLNLVLPPAVVKLSERLAGRDLIIKAIK